jgi:hypothetical protein
MCFYPLSSHIPFTHTIHSYHSLIPFTHTIHSYHSLIPFSHDSFISFVISIDFDSLLYCGVSYCTLKYYVYDNFLFYQPVTFFFFFLRLRCSVCTTTCSVFHFDFFSFSTCVWCCIPPLALCVLFPPLYFYFKIGLFLLFISISRLAYSSSL